MAPLFGVLFVDANAKATVYQYNKDNEGTATIDPNGHQMETVFDKKGQVLAGYDGNQNGTFSGYNADGQATGSGLGTGSSTTQVVTASGQVAQETDPDNNLTRTLHDLD